MTTQQSTQLTDTDIQEMLDRNRLQISFNAETSKYELRRVFGARTLYLKSCQFKTPLIVAVRMIDTQRSRTA